MVVILAVTELLLRKRKGYICDSDRDLGDVDDDEGGVFNGGGGEDLFICLVFGATFVTLVSMLWPSSLAR